MGKDSGQESLFDPLESVARLVTDLWKENPEAATALTADSGLIGLIHGAIEQRKARDAHADRTEWRHHCFRVIALVLGYVFAVVVLVSAMFIGNDDTKQKVVMLAVGAVFSGGGFALGRSTKDKKKY